MAASAKNDIEVSITDDGECKTIQNLKNYGFCIGVMYQYDINGLLVGHETHGKTEKNLMYDGISEHDNCDYVKSYTNKYGVKITIYFYNKHNYVMRHIEKYVNGKYVDSWKQIDVEGLNVLDDDSEYDSDYESEEDEDEDD